MYSTLRWWVVAMMLCWQSGGCVDNLAGDTDPGKWVTVVALVDVSIQASPRTQCLAAPGLLRGTWSRGQAASHVSTTWSEC